MVAYGTAQEARRGDRVEEGGPLPLHDGLGTVTEIRGTFVNVVWDEGGWSWAPTTDFFPIVRAPKSNEVAS